MNENAIHKDEIEIDLLDLVQALLRKWWLIGGAAVIGAFIMAVVTMFFITPMYKSSAMLYVLNKTTTITSVADFQIGNALSADFQVIATSKPVIDGAIAKIQEEDGITLTRKEVADALEVSNKEDTRLLVIDVIHEDPEIACKISNAITDVTATRMAEIMNTDPPTIVEWAEVSKNPESPSFFMNVVIGGMIGAFLVCLVLVVLYLINDSVKTEEDIERYLGVPTLVMIPFVSEKERKREMMKKNGASNAKQ